jgi:hypothetical protein
MSVGLKSKADQVAAAAGAASCVHMRTISATGSARATRYVVGTGGGEMINLLVGLFMWACGDRMVERFKWWRWRRRYMRTL